MLDDVVSVARPASSDGGSAPTDMRNTPALPVRPNLPVAATEVPTTITARRPTSPAHIIERFRILLLPPSEGACDDFPPGALDLCDSPPAPRRPDPNQSLWADAAVVRPGRPTKRGQCPLSPPPLFLPLYSLGETSRTPACAACGGCSPTITCSAAARLCRTS